MTAVLLDPLAAVNTGNGDTGPAWAVALFAVAWVALASFIIFMNVKKWKNRRK